MATRSAPLERQKHRKEELVHLKRKLERLGLRDLIDQWIESTLKRGEFGKEENEA